MKTKPLHFFIITEQHSIFTWLSATLEMSCINTDKVEKIDINQLPTLEFNANTQALILLETTIYKKNSESIHQHLSQLYVDIPLLLLTDSVNNKNLNSLNKMFNVIDTIARPTLSISSLEHTVNSLIKDFNLTQQLKKLAHYDALTGAANRYLFQDRLMQIFKRAKRYNETFALLSFDLNEFKKVNDAYGHEVGDLLLKKFVAQLTKIKRDTDTLARLGGDEFSMIISNITEDNLYVLVNKIKDLFSKEFTLATQLIKIKTSIGGVIISPNKIDKITINKALKLADEAVYEAKLLKVTAAVIKTA